MTRFVVLSILASILALTLVGSSAMAQSRPVGADDDARMSPAPEPTVSPTPAAPVVNIDADPVGYASNTYGAAKAGKWLVFVGFLIIGLVYVVRRWGSKLIPWIATDRGGVATALVCGFLASLASTVISSGSISGPTLIVAVEQSIAAIGGFVVLKKLIFPSDAKV